MPLRILVVDDENGILHFFRAVLGSSFHHPIITVNNAELALTALEKIEGIILVITDLNMPGMNGIDLINEIKSKYPDLPVILNSGDDLRHLGQHPYGANIYLQKPFHHEKLIKAVKSLLPDSH